MTAAPKRKGGRRKGQVVRKATNDEIEKRIEEVESMMARGAKKSQIHKKLCKAHSIHWKTVDNYIARARNNWLKRVNKPRIDHIGDVFATLENIILTSKDNNEVMRATKQKRELLALDAPKRIEVTGTDGKPIEIDAVHSIRQLPQSTVIEMVKLLDAAEQESEAGA